MKNWLVIALILAQFAVTDCAVVNASDSLNLGFEETFTGTSNLDPELGNGGPRRVLAPGEVLLPTNWIRTSNNLVMESMVLRDKDFTGPDFPSEGNNFLYFFSANFGVNRFAGQYVEQSTVLDLTQIESLAFDFGRNRVDSSVDPFARTYFRIDDAVMWSLDGPSPLKTVQVDVSNVKGPTEVSFGLEITQDHFGGPAGPSYIDNIVLTPVPEPSTAIFLAIASALYVSIQRGQASELSHI